MSNPQMGISIQLGIGDLFPYSLSRIGYLIPNWGFDIPTWGYYNQFGIFSISSLLPRDSLKGPLGIGFKAFRVSNDTHCPAGLRHPGRLSLGSSLRLRPWELQRDSFSRLPPGLFHSLSHSCPAVRWSWSVTVLMCLDPVRQGRSSMTQKNKKKKKITILWKRGTSILGFNSTNVCTSFTKHCVWYSLGTGWVWQRWKKSLFTRPGWPKNDIIWKSHPIQDLPIPGPKSRPRPQQNPARGENETNLHKRINTTESSASKKLSF